MDGGGEAGGGRGLRVGDEGDEGDGEVGGGGGGREGRLGVAAGGGVEGEGLVKPLREGF